MNDDMQAFIDWLPPEWQNIVTISGYYPAPNVDIQELLSVLKQQPEQNQPDREPILLTPKNMKQHGFDLAITVNGQPHENITDPVIVPPDGLLYGVDDHEIVVIPSQDL